MLEPGAVDLRWGSARSRRRRDRRAVRFGVGFVEWMPWAASLALAAGCSLPRQFAVRDGASDVASDAASDARADTQADALTDAASDARADALPDAPPDAFVCPHPDACNFVAVRAGATFTCARDGAGGVFCWGDNTLGQIGGDPSVGFVALALRVPGIDQVADLSVGADHACVVLASDHSVWCWGSNQSGQMGTGTPDNDPHALPTRVAGLDGSPVVSVTCGTTNTCVIRQDHSVLCWGGNLHGECGTNMSTAPVAVTAGPVTPPSVEPFVSVSAGNGYTCGAQGSGDLSCWGLDVNGQCGVRSVDAARSSDGMAVVLGPATVTDLSIDVPFIRPALLSRTVFAYEPATQQLKCWGADGAGLCNHNTLDPSVPVPFNGLPQLRALAWANGSSEHMCTITDVGTVICWGANDVAQCGLAPSSSAPPSEVPGLANVTDVSVGRLHSCAVSNGAVYCWGNNNSGALGTVDDVGQTRAAPRPIDFMNGG